MLRCLTAVCLIALGTAARPAAAQELIGGVYAHAANTPLSLDTGEHGIDLEAGYRFAPLEALSAIGRPAPYLIASLNTAGDTSFAGAGLSWKLGKGPIYLRPGIGLVVNTGPAFRLDPVSQTRTDLGSRVTFELELAVGTQLTPRLGIEASWVHISHARLFNREQNPGLDMIGLRLTYAVN